MSLSQYFNFHFQLSLSTFTFNFHFQLLLSTFTFNFHFQLSLSRNGLIEVEESVLASNEMAELVSKLQEERSGAVIFNFRYTQELKNDNV